MCPQQAAPPMMPPPPPFPFPPPFMQQKKKKKKSKKGKHGSHRSSEARTNRSQRTGSNVPGAPEDEEGEGIPEDGVGMDTNEGGENEEAPPHEIDMNQELYENENGSLEDQQGGNQEMGGDTGNTGRQVQGRNGQGQAVNTQGLNPQSTNRQVQPDGTIVTTVDLPPGEGENVAVMATRRKNPNEPTVDVVAELEGGKAAPGPPGQTLAPTQQRTNQDGTTVTSYKLPPGKDGYVKASSQPNQQQPKR